MDQRSFQKLLRRTVALPVVLLVLLVAILAVESFLLYISMHWVDHSDQVISTARQLQRQVVEMETALRGYSLTGDQSFLDAYNEAKSKVPDQLDSLQQLTSDNPAQQQRLREARDADLSWIQWTDGQVRGGAGNPLAAADLLHGQQLLDQTRIKQRAFVGAEEVLREARARRAYLMNSAVIGSAIVLSLLVAIVLFSLTRRELMALSATYEKHLQAEAQQSQLLKEGRERLQITLESLGEAVVSTDHAGNVSFVNPAAERLTGWGSEAALGRPFGEVVRLSDERTGLQLEDPIDAVRHAEKVVGFSNSVVLASREGKQYPVELTGAPILHDGHEVVGVVVVFRDVTQRRQTEQTLRASERLTLAGRLSATIAHEIRNPLDTVTNLVYLLQHEQPSPTSAQYLQMASEELTRIAQITGQLLTFHREAKSPVPVNLTEVLESVLVLFAPQIKQNHISVERRFESNRTVRGFPGELRQVFSNLVGNAVEAMAGGGRLVLHTRESSLASDPTRKGIRVTVLDSGTGIPFGVRRNLFAPFYTTKGEKGTGLGLWVSRGILDKHEGTIHISSSVGTTRKGTAFSIFLPFQQKLGMLDVKPKDPVI